jgi:dolichol-phosphate mannosyltransferase
MSARFLAVVPAYNEEETIEEVATRAGRFADVCVVDDASVDATPEILSRLPAVHTIRHETNTHIARGILDGFRYARDAGYDFCITLDAGLSHDPDALPEFQKHTEVDLVLGYRAQKSDVPLYRRTLSWCAKKAMNLALEQRRVPWGGAGLRDVTSGYRMYSRRAFELLLASDFRARTFDFHLEALARVYRAGMRVEEIPISYAFTNSSLQAGVVGDAVRTCLWLWRADLA